MYIVEWSYPDDKGNMVYESETFETRKYANLMVSVITAVISNLNSVTLSEVDE